MIKVFSVVTLVLVPLVWGLLMAPVLDFLEYRILGKIRKPKGSV